jgi:glutamyl-tRNA reductase
MIAENIQDISGFFIAGINYKKTDEAIRGSFAIGDDQYARILEAAKLTGVKELFILSTCNRTEIYGLSSDVSTLIELLCAETAGDISTFKELAYIKNGLSAVEHLFNVGAGLDSQILGDYEIVGQIKNAVKVSKQHGCIGAFLERLVNSVLQSSKTIKNQTALSGGTVSVSFAAVQYIKEKFASVRDKKVLLLGVGKIGRNTCKNLVDYLDTNDITLINRTEEKAATLASSLEINYASILELHNELKRANIIIVATNSPEPTIHTVDLQGLGEKLVIDLSIPYNVEPSAAELPNVTLVHVDELSRLKDETLQKREAEVPKAKAIIREHIEEFVEWHEMRKHVPVLRAVKLKLQQIHGDRIFLSKYSAAIANETADQDQDKIQKVINGMAVKMRQKNHRGCHYIEAINEFMAGAAIKQTWKN